MNWFSIILCALSIGLAIFSTRLSRKAERLSKSLSDEVEISERHLAEVADERDAYRKVLDELERYPEGCKPGQWCSACIYGKTIIRHFGKYETVRATACRFGACKNFSLKEEVTG